MKDVAAIIQKYVDSRIRKRGNNIQLRCPFHKGGKEKHPSFSFSETKGVGQCFTCGWTGTLYRLLLEVRVPKQLVERLLEGMEFEAPRRESFIRRNRFETPFPLPDWTLGAFRRCPVHLVQAGFRESAMQEHEVGADVINSRVTWPVRDLYGNLAGLVGGPLYEGQLPKYQVYLDEVIRSVLGDFVPFDYDFDNHKFLWMAHRVVRETTGPVIVVEGFKAGLWLRQHGHLTTVAQQGTVMSNRQRDILIKMGRPVMFFLDNNKPGKIGASKSAGRLEGRLPVKIVDYGTDDPDLQPDDLKPRYLERVLSRPKNPGEWRRTHGIRRLQQTSGPGANLPQAPRRGW